MHISSLKKLFKYKIRKAYALYYPNSFRIPDINYSQREITVARLLKRFSHLDIKSFLNVGFHSWEEEQRHWWIKICKANQIDWRILEAYESNVKNALAQGCPKNHISEGNILNVTEYNQSDCIMFWHGPEHLEKKAFLKVLPEIEKKARKLLIFGMPLGHEPQGPAYGNPYEEHVSSWEVEDWKSLGYNVITVHDRKIYPHITVYKVMD